MKFCFCAAVLLTICLLLGCSSGGGTSGTGNGGSASGIQTLDMGTLTEVNDSYIYTLANAAASGSNLSISSQSQTAGTVLSQQTASGAGAEIDWHFIPMGSGQYNVENMLTHQVMGVSNASTSAGAQVVEWADNGTSDHLWEFYLLSDGNYLIKNVNSGLYLESVSSRSVDQGTRATSGAGCNCQEWTLTSTGSSPYPDPSGVNVSYSSPDSSSTGIHDPSMAQVGGMYNLFSTHGLLHEHQSSDLVNFSDGGYALSSLPAWTNAFTGGSGDLWAPDVSIHNGEVWLYYAASTFGSTQSGIGLAVSPNGQPGSFVDSGAAIYVSSNCSGSNAIDPASVVDFAGNAWLVFGSWSSGIQIIPVSTTTGVPTGAACTQLADHPSGTGIEGAYVYPYGGYYYLFASIDTCCNGVSSTYRIIVGRAASVMGPYTDRGGIPLTQGGGTILLSSHSNINGPGGESVFTGASGAVLVYHYYDGNNGGSPALGLNQLGWTSDGWPYVK